MNKNKKPRTLEKIGLVFNKIFINIFLAIKYVFINILKVIKYFFIGIFEILVSIRSFFTIPILTICSSIILLLFLLFFKPIINFLPDNLNVGFIETFLSAMIFIFLRFVLFKDKLLHDFDFDHNKSILLFILTSVIWIFPILFFSSEGYYAQIILAEGKLFTLPSFIYVALYLPHMWIATLTGEFFYSVMANIVLNCVIATLITLKFKNDFIQA